MARASERYPEQRYTYVALGRVWLEIAQARSDRSRSSKAIGALEGAVGSEDSSEALTLFGRALLMASDAETAERMLMDATARKPVEPAAFAYLADAAERLSHFSVARQALIDYEALRGEAEPPRRARERDPARRPVAPDERPRRCRGRLDSRGRRHRRCPSHASRGRAGPRRGSRCPARATVVRALEQDPNNVRAQALYRRLTVEREVPKEPKKSEGE